MTVALFGFLLLQIKCPALKRRDSSSYLCSSAAAKRFNHRHHLHNKPCSTTANNNSSSLSHFTFQSSLFNLFNQVQHYHPHHRINFDLFVILLCSLIRSVSQPVQSAMESSQQSSHRSHLVNKRRRRKMQSWSASSSSNERSLRFQRLKTNLNLAFSTMLLLSLLLHPANSQLSANQSTNSIQRLSKRQTLQRFLVEPDNLTVNIGESVVLPCRVSNKAGTLQWTRDGFGLGTDPRLEGFPNYSMMQNEATGDYSLKISSVTLEDDASFQCQIGALDTVPGIRSQTARITVQVAPSEPVIVTGDFVNANPSARKSQQVLLTTAGTTVELTCEAHGGRPAPELAWLNGRNRVVKKGTTSKITPLNDGKRFNAALRWTFEPTKADHLKRVSCRSSHPTSSNSSLASLLLEVKYPPEVKVEVIRVKAISSQNALNAISSSGNLHGMVGDTLKVKCIADGNPGANQEGGLTYKWFKDGEAFWTSGQLDDNGSTTSGESELVLPNLDRSWNGVDIRCQVANSVGTGRATVTLNIAYGPVFSPSMEYLVGAGSGETVRLGCKVDSNPSPEITWIRVGGGSGGSGNSGSNVLSSSGGSKLTIRNFSPDHAGEYLCRASVKGFPEISAIIYLRMNGPPKIRKAKRGGSGSSSNYAVAGESGHVSCLVESVPSPIAITWLHNEQVFTTSSTAASTSSNVHITETRMKEEPNIIRASFDIKDTGMSDFGHYNCVVINSYGSDWHVVTLEQQTSFATIVTITSIFISALVFIVLSTIICLLWVKHRKLVRRQKEKDQAAADGSDLKKHYLSTSTSNSSNASSSDNHSHSSQDNQNIYSTASTRTNSTSAEKTATGETGTIITRSGSTGGSPRSSTSSFPPYMEATSSGSHHHHLHHPHQHQHHSPAPSHQGLAFATLGHHPNHHHHHQHQLTHPPHLHPAFANQPSHSPFSFSPFHEMTTVVGLSASHRADINHSLGTYHPTSPLSAGDTAFSSSAGPHFNSLNHRASISGPPLPSPYSVLVPLCQDLGHHGHHLSSHSPPPFQNQSELYLQTMQAGNNPFQQNLVNLVGGNRQPFRSGSQVRSSVVAGPATASSSLNHLPLPTPPPTLTQMESKASSSIATHV